MFGELIYGPRLVRRVGWLEVRGLVFNPEDVDSLLRMVQEQHSTAELAVGDDGTTQLRPVTGSVGDLPIGDRQRLMIQMPGGGGSTSISGPGPLSVSSTTLRTRSTSSPTVLRGSCFGTEPRGRSGDACVG